jgi:hypothetical protein
MSAEELSALFSQDFLAHVFPPERTDAFFDALFGDPKEGAYDIRLSFLSGSEVLLNFAFELHQRGNACLACNLTHGLPHVFKRHPVINVDGLSKELARRAGWEDGAWDWHIGDTVEVSRALHIVPLQLAKHG